MWDSQLLSQTPLFSRSPSLHRLNTCEHMIVLKTCFFKERNKWHMFASRCYDSSVDIEEFSGWKHLQRNPGGFNDTCSQQRFALALCAFCVLYCFSCQSILLACAGACPNRAWPKMQFFDWVFPMEETQEAKRQLRRIYIGHGVLIRSFG